MFVHLFCTDSIDFSFVSSDGTSGEDPFSAVLKGYVILPICEIGLVVCLTSSGGLHPLRGSCCPASRGSSTKAPNPLFSAVWWPTAISPSLFVHHLQSALVLWCVAHGAFQTSFPSLKWWSALWMAPILGDEEDWGFLQRPRCNFSFFQSCLCKWGCKLSALLGMIFPVPLKKLNFLGCIFY